MLEKVKPNRQIPQQFWQNHYWKDTIKGPYAIVFFDFVLTFDLIIN